jgi:hypothetical protein
VVKYSGLVTSPVSTWVSGIVSYVLAPFNVTLECGAQVHGRECIAIPYSLYEVLQPLRKERTHTSLILLAILASRVVSGG